MRRNLFYAFVLASLCIPAIGGIAFAEESTVNKVKDDAGDIKTDTKKLARKGTQKVRKATGNDNVMKDAKDKVNDAGDDISNSADKLKRKSDSN